MHALRHGSDVSAVMLRVLDDAEQAAARMYWSGGGAGAALPPDTTDTPTFVGVGAPGLAFAPLGAVVAAVRAGLAANVEEGLTLASTESRTPRAVLVGLSEEMQQPIDPTPPPGPVQTPPPSPPMSEIEYPEGKTQPFRERYPGVFDLDLENMVRQRFSLIDILNFMSVTGLAGTACCIQVVVQGFDPSATRPHQFDHEGERSSHQDHAIATSQNCACVVTLNILWNGWGDPDWTDGRWRTPSAGYIQRFVSALMNALGPAAEMAAKVFIALRQLNPHINIVASGHSLGAAMLLASLRHMAQSYVINTLVLIQTDVPMPLTLAGQSAFLSGLIAALKLDNPQETPVGNIVWASDAQDTVLANVFAALDELSMLAAISALFGQQPPGQTGFVAMGISTLFASLLAERRDTVCPGWGGRTIHSFITHSAQN